MLERSGISLPVGADWLKSLNPFAVAFRYDDTEPRSLDTAGLLEVVRTVRKWAGDTVT